ncbi:hypothetical protein GQ54DRAFT_312949 [Martensiomyces pterosporus]|nr:hypothetical protein GQ54DRAFT_312949 [Martensiomyces pterosporus]
MEPPIQHGDSAPWLAPDILYLITKRFYEEYVRHKYISSRRLENLQPMASTCTAWRQATLPFLYGSVVYELIEFKSPNPFKTLTKWKTNLDLLVASGSTQKTRKLVIVSNNVVIDPSDLLSLLTMHKFDAHSWPNISALNFYQGDRFYSNTSIPAFDPSMTVGMNEYLSACLPSLKRVHYQSPIDNGLYRENPFNVLINSRLQGLSEVVIWSHYYPLLTSQTFSPGLTTLSIRCFSRGAMQLPHILSDSLVELCLTDISQTQVWDILFMTSSSSQLARFPNLRCLDLDFAPEPAHTNGDWGLPMGAAIGGQWIAPLSPSSPSPGAAQLAFSRLQRLYIREYTYNISDFLAFFPCHTINRVLVECSGRGILSLDLEAFKQLQRADVSCAGLVRFGHDRAEKFAHQLLSATSSVRKLRLTIMTQPPLELPAKVGCVNLRLLELRSPVALESIAPLLDQMPHLWKLCLPYVTTGLPSSGRPESFDSLRADVAAQQGPISTSVQKIIMGFWDYKQCTRALCCQILAFLVRIPSLLTLVHDTEFAKALQTTISTLHFYNIEPPSHLQTMAIWNHVTMSS